MILTMLIVLLYIILIMSIRAQARNLFPISLMTISTISALFIIEARSETLPMIPSRKLFFVVLSNLGYNLFVCPHCGNESIVPHKCHTPNSVLLVALKRLNCVLFIFSLSLSMPSTVISSLPFQNI